jgi:hypothetical protein
MSTSAPTNDINSTTARPDPGGEYWPEGDLPEQMGGQRTTLLPGIYTFRLPENLAQLWKDVEIEDGRPFLPNGMPNPTKGQKILRKQLKLDRNAPLVVVGGPHDGEPMTATFTNNPRARGKKDDSKTAWISDLAYLLDQCLQGDVPPAQRLRPKTADELVAAINRYAGKTIRLETGLTAQCRPDKVRYVRITTQEPGQPEQATDMLDPAQIKGCGKRYYSKDFKNPTGGVVDPATGVAQPMFDTEIACVCGHQPTPAQVEAGAQPGVDVVLRGFEQVERFLPPLGTK